MQCTHRNIIECAFYLCARKPRVLRKRNTSLIIYMCITMYNVNVPSLTKHVRICSCDLPRHKRNSMLRYGVSAQDVLEICEKTDNCRF